MTLDFESGFYIFCCIVFFAIAATLFVTGWGKHHRREKGSGFLLTIALVVTVFFAMGVYKTYDFCWSRGYPTAAEMEAVSPCAKQGLREMNKNRYLFDRDDIRIKEEQCARSEAKEVLVQSQKELLKD
jgi:hypothetical protein